VLLAVSNWDGFVLEMVVSCEKGADGYVRSTSDGLGATAEGLFAALVTPAADLRPLVVDGEAVAAAAALCCAGLAEDSASSAAAALAPSPPARRDSCVVVVVSALRGRPFGGMVTGGESGVVARRDCRVRFNSATRLEENQLVDRLDFFVATGGR